VSGGDLFHSAWRKWQRAVLHAEALQADIDDFAVRGERKPVLRARADYEPKRHAFVVRVDQVDRGVPVEWSAVLGDVAFNFRSCLDHVAWALAGRGTVDRDALTERKKRRIQFPLERCSDTFKKRLADGWLPGVEGADLALVRRHQPYMAPKRNQALAVLHSLNNFDKHRELKPALLVPRGVTYEATNLRQCVISRDVTRVRAVAVEKDAEICTIRVRKTGPEPRLDVQLEVALQVALGDLAPVEQKHVTVQEWVEATTRLVSGMLIVLDSPPDDVVATFAPIADRAHRARRAARHLRSL
jgi:hypothetical protein